VPPWRAGGRLGFTVDACALPESTGWVLELSLRLPPATIRQLASDDAGRATVRASARLKSRGHGTQESTHDYTIPVADTTLGLGRVVLLRFPAAPGPCEVRVQLTDMLSKRRAIVRAVGEDHESMEIAGTVQVPALQAGQAISDIEFLWPEVRGDEGLTFVRAGRVVVPNPDRLYGLLANTLRARIVARGRPGAEPREWHWVARVYDAAGQGVAQHDSTGPMSTSLDGEMEFDVSSLPAGTYTLEVKAWPQDEPGALQRRARFSIGWQADTWLRSAADVADDVHFLFDADDEDEFAVMPPGEQERRLQEFWARRDPTPETAANEAYDTFRHRVDYANENYSRFGGAQKGMFSDMGRVYIRYGEPSEVLKQVMPAGSETLTAQLQKILDTENRSPEDVAQKGLGGDQRPYEVWIYEAGLVHLPLNVDPSDASRGRFSRRLVFLFVDELGTGLYRLRYSTE
jgi:GWxTD domain-containing protein